MKLPRARRAGGTKWPWGLLSAPGGLWLLVLFLVPLGFVVAMSLGTTGILGQPHYGWHPGNYTQVFQPDYLPVMVRTLLYVVAATAISLAMAFIISYTLVFYMRKGRGVILALIVLPWLVDYLIRIYALLEIFSHGLLANVLGSLGLTQGGSLTGTPAVIIGLVYNYAPLAIIPTYASMSQIDPLVVDASRDLYAGRLQSFRTVVLRLSSPGAVSGGLLVFMSSLGDFATAQLLGGPRSYMVGNLIQDQFSGLASLPVGAGLTVALLLMMAISAYWYARASRAISRELVT
jgi:spermidine/putrescine transport system permease protein